MEEFLALFQGHFKQGTFVKLTLSKPASKSADLSNIYLRRVRIKTADYVQFTYRYQQKDIIKNYDIAQSIDQLNSHLGKDFLHATLLSTREDVSLFFNKKRKVRLQKRRATSTHLPKLDHNKTKNYLIEEDAAFLEQLGVASKGRVHKAHQDKYRQINKYVEVMSGLLEQADLPQSLQIVDMGCGKGYLTFALHDFLLRNSRFIPTVVGIELREHLTSFCSTKAAALGWQNLSFIAQDIQQFDAEKIDVLIALHACDIATDIAIAKGIQADAQLIVCAPCCHKQIRKAMQSDNRMQSILKNGILEERQAEILTDGIRALMLEAYGYETKVFEFIALEHTAKNIMITAVKRKEVDKPDASTLREVASLKKMYGIQQHYLEKLLAQNY
jgi:cyclopropane fatty-acyl-phospholipid synthase-like methyltransferase